MSNNFNIIKEKFSEGSVFQHDFDPDHNQDTAFEYHVFCCFVPIQCTPTTPRVERHRVITPISETARKILISPFSQATEFCRENDTSGLQAHQCLGATARKQKITNSGRLLPLFYDDS